MFLVSSDESPNLNQMIEAIARDGYIVAQEVLTEPTGRRPAVRDERGAAARRRGLRRFRRVNTGPDLRSNMHVGGKPDRSR